MSTLEIVDKEISNLIDDPVKDLDWYYRISDIIEGCDDIKGYRGVMMALTSMAAAYHLEYTKSNLSRGKSTKALYIAESKSMGYIKIGRAFDITERAKSLKIACPDIKITYTFDYQGDIEPIIHDKLKNFCVSGEWFSVSVDYAAAIVKEVISNGHNKVQYVAKIKSRWRKARAAQVARSK